VDLSVHRLIVSVFAVVVGVLALWSASALAAAPEAPVLVTVEHVGAARVTVLGVLNPNVEGQPGTYEFLYRESSSGPGCERASKAPEAPGIVFGFEHQGVSQELTGLSPDTEYTVCLVDRNLDQTKGEEAVSSTVTFKTRAALEAPTTGAASEITSVSAKLQGVLSPGKPGEPGTYEFLYRQSASECEHQNPETRVEESEHTSTEPALGAEKEVVPAAPVEVGGLSPNTDYTFCLLARNEAGETALGAPVTFKTKPRAPRLSGETVAHLGSTSATVTAQVEPGGLETTYGVQYGTSAAYGSESSSTKVTGEITATVSLTGLQPSTEYHFRFVATNAEGTVQGEDVSFTTYPESVSGLPDGRVYELASPFALPSGEADWPGQAPDGSVESESPFEASPDGESVTFAGFPTVGGSARQNRQGNQYLASHLPDGGWSLMNISPPSDEWATYGEQRGILDASFSRRAGALSGNLSSGVMWLKETVPPLIATEAPIEPPYGTESKLEFPMLYLRSFSEGIYRPLFAVRPPNRTGEEEFLVSAADVSADSTHVLFEADDMLVGGEGSLEKELSSIVAEEAKEYREIKVLQRTAESLTVEARALENEGKYTEAEVKHKESERLEEERSGLESLYGEIDERSELYVSVGGSVSLVNVSPEGRVLPGSVFGGTHEISTDDSRIFWTSKGNPDAVFVRENGSSTVQVSQGPAEFVTASIDGKYAFYTEAGKLWRFDVEDGARLELAGSGGGVQDVIGTNETGEDGAYVYFVAHEALTSELNASKQGAVEGEDNLYAFEPDPGHAGGSRIAFIAALSGVPTAYMTPNGHAVAFSSSQNLLGHPYPDEGSEEVYVYDAEDSSLFCASCRAQVSGGNLDSGHRWVSEDGDQVFFNSEAPLVANDIDGVRDVYEWERDGSGACTEPDGCVYLLSGGIEGPAGLLDASANGSDVFIVTRQELVPETQNQNVEVYDARVDGKLTVAAPQCSGTGCQGAPAAAPIFATPASVTFNGVGNFPPPTGVKGATTKTLTRAQKLSRALSACRKRRSRKARTVCESKARKLYGAKSKARKSAKREAK
jgi:hypothetical protein